MEGKLGSRNSRVKKGSYENIKVSQVNVKGICDKGSNEQHKMALSAMKY